jgi:hypothetical protein
MSGMAFATALSVMSHLQTLPSKRTRRLRTIGRFNSGEIAAAVATMFRRQGLDCLSDEQVDEVAKILATDHRLHQAMARDNRAVAA